MFFGFQTNAQVRLVNLSLKDSTVKEMYKGWANAIQILSNNHNKEYELRTTKSSRVIPSKYEKNKVIVLCNRIGIDTFKIYEGNQLLKEEYFEIKKIPQFRPWIGQPGKTYLSKEQIITSGKIFVVNPVENLKRNHAPISFEIVIKDAQGNIINQGKNDSFKINEEYLETIKGLERNSSILFSRVKLYPSPDCGGAIILSPLLISIR